MGEMVVNSGRTQSLRGGCIKLRHFLAAERIRRSWRRQGGGFGERGGEGVEEWIRIPPISPFFALALGHGSGGFGYWGSGMLVLVSIVRSPQKTPLIVNSPFIPSYTSWPGQVN